MAPGKAGIPGFVPNLAVPGQLSPLALPAYPAVDPAAASALQGCLAAAFDGSVPQPSFGGSLLSGSINAHKEVLLRLLHCCKTGLLLKYFIGLDLAWHKHLKGAVLVQGRQAWLHR